MINEITKRAVLYVGFKCNASCQFCYYRYQEGKEWRPLNDLLRESARYRYFYKNRFVDITGGEPTIYPRIMELVKHCSRIGLKPSIITNAFALADRKKCLEFRNNGINDFLVSIFGLGKTADEVTGVTGAHEKQKKALDNLVSLKIPFRINVTVHRYTSVQLPDIARMAVKKKARVMNMIVFNPFLGWRDRMNIEFQEKYSAMAPYMIKAIHILEKNGVEANIRYMPLCMLRGFERNNYNFMQLSYDPYEWDLNSWGNFFKIHPSERWYMREALRKRVLDCDYRKSDKCRTCSASCICDGFHKQYSDRFGFGEEKPYALGKRISSPDYFVRRHEKLRDVSGGKNPWLLPYVLKDYMIIKDALKGRFRLASREIAFRKREVKE